MTTSRVDQVDSGSQNTEELIKETARKLFFVKGKLNATTQEIADEAGVNRALLHYYFRTRDKLFEELLKDALMEAYQRSFNIITSDLPFEEKIAALVSNIIDRVIAYPYMESFIISEVIKKPEHVIMLQNATIIKGESKEKFGIEIQRYIEEHNLAHLSPQHFIANMISLCAFPSIAKPVMQNMFQYSEQEYLDFMAQRKKVITDLLLGRL